MKYFLLAAIFMFLSFFISSGHPLTGVSVTPEGDLLEPFYLIPLSILCFILASFCVVVGLIRRKT